MQQTEEPWERALIQVKRINLFIKERREYLLLGLCLCLGGILFFYNAGNYYLWGDEGVTAFYGKNTLKFGLPYGFDGRNLLEFSNGIYLNRIFLPLIDPWAQYYVSAASQAIFGQSSFGARALFIVFGLAAVLAQYFFVRRYFGDKRLALINALLMISSVLYILFSRQSRYYALGMFLSPVICYFYARHQSRPVCIGIAAVLFIAFFLSNSLIGMALLLAMSISFFAIDEKKKSLSFFLLPFPILVIAVGLFMAWLYSYGMPANPAFLKNIHPSDFGNIVWLYFKDYNETQLLPVGMIIILILSWITDGGFRGKSGFDKIRKECVVISIIIIFTVILSVISPQESRAMHSDIRYATPIFPMLLLVQAFAINRIFLWRKPGAAILFAVVIFTNLLTFLPFRSYFFEFAKENIHPFDNSVKVAVQFLERRIGDNDIILVSPNHMLGSMAYYLSDKALFCNVIGEDNKNLIAAGVRMPRYIYSSETIPQWIVLFGLDVDTLHTAEQLKRLNLTQYKVHALPILGPDVSRPELFWRSFKPIDGFKSSRGLFVLERQKAAVE